MTVFVECNHLKLRWGILCGKNIPKVSRGALFQLVLPVVQRETTPKGCHDEVGHLGLECILGLMHDYFFWPNMAAQAREHIDKCHPCITFKARQPRELLENIVATHPLQLNPPHLFVLRASKRERKHASGNRLLHPICPDICNPITDCPNNS